VVLTVAHLDHNPANCDPENLRAMCQRCHLAYDAEHHRRNAARTRAVKRAGDTIPLLGTGRPPGAGVAQENAGRPPPGRRRRERANPPSGTATSVTPAPTNPTVPLPDVANRAVSVAACAVRH